MKNYSLRLDEYTISAKGSCMFTTQEEAKLAFLRQGVFGRVTLAQVFSLDAAFDMNNNPENMTESVVVKFFWVCYKDDGSISYIPLFYEDADLDEFQCDDLRPLDKTTLIYRNKQVYVLSVDSKKRINVRLLTLYYCQEFIEILCMLQGIKPTEICLDRLFTSWDNKEAGICWVIVHETRDDKGETSEKAMFMPVNIFDGPKLYQIGLNNMDVYPVEVGDDMEISGVLYHLEKTGHGKLVLAKKNLQVVGKKITQAQQYKIHCSKIVFNDESDVEATDFKIVPPADLPKQVRKGKAVIVSMKKDEV